MNQPPLTVFSLNLTMRSGKPTTTRAKEPVSASKRLGETIFWSRAALRFSLGSCSHDSIWGTDASAGRMGVNRTEHHGRDKNSGGEMLRSLNKREGEREEQNTGVNVPDIALVWREI